MTREIKNIPYLGCGIGLRAEIAEKTLAHKNEIDVLEIVAEQFFPNSRPRSIPFLQKFSSQFPIIPHGVKLSIGSAAPLEKDFFGGMKELSAMLNASFYSDHFALTRLGEDLDTGHLSPLWFTKEMLEHVVRRVDETQQALGVPLVLENITAEIKIQEADFEEPEFITEVCRRTGCGLLLDVTNININACNHREDPFALAERYPMDSVVYIHLAGGEIHHGAFKDTHSQELIGPNEKVWELLEWVLKRADIKALIIERDQNFKEDFELMVLQDLRKARAIVEAGKPANRQAGKTRVSSA